ncbi:uncharacterized protein VP01_3560g5 [Puccinia sorghi]|uniref:BED-type domain-containing protein n=1 Tax=Puccinia sorghi TaxID=27349 RepID=A0A0L6UVC7_9BASI|nr:uncharacterized protein VP01_3560g5 [Puccinia sorghi]
MSMKRFDVDGEAANNKKTTKAAYTKTCSQTSVKKSWCWTHFQDSPNTNVAIFQVMIKNYKCGQERSIRGSTKNFHKHLLKKHRLVDPKLNKKIDKTQADIAKYLLNGQMACKASFFLIFFLFLILFCTTLTDLRRSSLNSTTCHSGAREGQPPISPPLWGSLAHFIDHNFQMIDLTVSITPVQVLIRITFNLGQHTGKNFINLFYCVLEEYDCLKKINTITDDNASMNCKMAQELSKMLPSFNTHTHLLGCIAHVINLGAKAGLAVLGTIYEEDVREISIAELDSEQNLMSIL